MEMEMETCRGPTLLRCPRKGNETMDPRPCPLLSPKVLKNHMLCLVNSICLWFRSTGTRDESSSQHNLS